MSDPTTIPILSDEGFASWTKCMMQWRCPACLRTPAAFLPERHEVPQTFAKRCRCGTLATFHVTGGTWHYVAGKRFFVKRKRWSALYTSEDNITVFIRRGRSGRTVKAFKGLIALKRFKDVLAFL